MRATLGARRLRLGALAALILCAAPAGAQQPAAPPAAVVASPQPPLAPAPETPVAPPAATALPAAAAPGSAAPPAESVGPIPTSDETPAASDHDAVVGHLGIAARRLDPGPLPLLLRPGQGCAADMITPPCTVTMGAVGARYWMTRNVALNGYLALATGGGSVGSADLDTYLGVGPIVGMTLLLGNWRHLAIGASPELAVVWFRPAGGDADSTTLIELRAPIEGELHFGFIGVPALSIGLQAGVQVNYEHAPSAHLWSAGVIGAGSIWDALTNLYVRYYL